MKYRPGTRVASIVFDDRLARVDAAQRHLGLVVAERAGRLHAPVRAGRAAIARELAVAELAHRAASRRARRTTAARSAAAARCASRLSSAHVDRALRFATTRGIRRPAGGRSRAARVPSQYDEICRIAGPERPRCVNSRFSRKRPPLHDDLDVERDARTGRRSARAASGAKRERHERGRGGTTARPNCSASS